MPGTHRPNGVPSEPLNATFAELLKALGENRSTISISIFPRDLVEGEPLKELLPLQHVLELEEGAIMAGEEADMADIVIIGGRLVKNRHGRVCHDVIGATVHLGTKFAIGQRVQFLRHRGGVCILARGEIAAVTQYLSREPSYYVTLDEETKGLMGVAELYVEEGEAIAIDQAGAYVHSPASKKPGYGDDARQAEPARDEAGRDPLEGLLALGVAQLENWKDRHNELYHLLRGLDTLRDLLGRPMPLGLPDLAEIGYLPAQHMANALREELMLMRALVAHEMDAIMAENAAPAHGKMPETAHVVEELRGKAIYIYATPAFMPASGLILHATLDGSEVYQAEGYYIGQISMPDKGSRTIPMP